MNKKQILLFWIIPTGRTAMSKVLYIVYSLRDETAVWSRQWIIEPPVTSKLHQFYACEPHDFDVQWQRGHGCQVDILPVPHGIN